MLLEWEKGRLEHGGIKGHIIEGEFMGECSFSDTFLVNRREVHGECSFF